MTVAYFILLALIAFQACDGACPNGYTQHNNSCYRASNDSKSWAAGLGICLNEGGYLVEITDAEENDFVTQLTHPPKGSKYRWYAVYYIGGTNNENGDWTWWKSNRAVNYSNWRHTPGGHERGCMVVNTNDGKWNELLCNLDTGYVCEHNLGAPT